MLRNKSWTVVVIVLLVLSTFAVTMEPMHEASMAVSDGGTEMAFATSSSSAAGRPMAMRKQQRHVEMEEMGMEEDAEDMAYDHHESAVSGDTMGKAVLDSLENSESPPKEPSVEGRLLVHSGHMSLQAFREDIKALADNIEKLVVEEGQGYVESRSSDNNLHDSYYGRHHNNQGRLSVDIHLRVSSKKFQDTVNSIRGMVGEDMVISVSTNSRDVTAEYVDASSRAETLDASRKALKLLLTRANSVNDVMNVQRELNRLTQQYESQQKRALVLKKQSDLSSLSVHLEEKFRENHEDPSLWWSPARAFWRAKEDIGGVLFLVGDIAVYAVTWAVPCVVLVGLFALLSKRR